MADPYERERTVDRSDAAGVLRCLADGVESGAVRLGGDGDEDAVDVTVPESVGLEVELEADEEDSERLELEVELEWTVAGTATDAPEDATDSAGIEPGASEVETGRSRDARPSSETGADAADAEASDAGTANVEDATDGTAPDARPSADDATAADESAATADAAIPVGAAAPVASLARFEVFRDRAEEWRWRLVHRNGNVIATSGEGYTRRHNAEKGLRSVVRNAPDAEVIEDRDASSTE